MVFASQRGETFIALRARREAMHVAGEIIYPPLELPRPAVVMHYRCAAQPVYEARLLGFLVYDDEVLPTPAPRWMKWLLTGCLLVIAAAIFVIFKMR